MATSLCSNLFSKAPIIVVLGATGTGKSKLAIDLALKFKGEVISADSMQVYKGLDIATNKVTKEEQMGVRHHLLGFLEPTKKLMVPEFRNMALSAIKDILERERIPIIVGGTNYYIESVLYNVLIDALTRKDNVSSENETENDTPSSPKRAKLNEDEEEFWANIEGVSNEALHSRLKEIDPEMAEVTHPNNRRKVIRSLQVFYQTGEPISAILRRQRSQPGGCDTGGPLRFTNSVVLWLQCDSDILNERLNARVDAMISQGLVKELLDFKTKCTEENVLNSSSSDAYTKGVLQTIGFKEFAEYLFCDEETRRSEKGTKLIESGVELLKVATRQYARRQNRWIKNRLLDNVERQVPPIYGLDATDPSKWRENVYEKAVHVVESHLSGRKPNLEPLKSTGVRVPIDKCYTCEICNKIMMGSRQWEHHLKGSKHHNVLKRRRKAEEEVQRNQKAVDDDGVEESKGREKA